MAVESACDEEGFVIFRSSLHGVTVSRRSHGVWTDHRHNRGELMKWLDALHMLPRSTEYFKQQAIGLVV